MNSKIIINQVTNILVVGMDIAKRVHYACFVDERGRVMKKAFAVHHSKEGFESLYDKILKGKWRFMIRSQTLFLLVSLKMVNIKKPSQRKVTISF